MGNGIYLLGGGPANSYMVEFRDFVAVFEAPGQRRAQPGGDRADREAGAEQADPLADQLAPALRSHRRAPHLPPHRRDRSSMHMNNLNFLNRDVLDLRRREPSSPTSCRCGRRPNWPRATTTKPSRRTSSSPTTAGSCASTTCSRCSHVDRHVDGVPARRAHRVRGGSVRHPSSRRRSADAGDDQLLESGETDEAGRATIAPVHGRPVPWAMFEKAMGPAANLCQTAGAAAPWPWCRVNKTGVGRKNNIMLV